MLTNIRKEEIKKELIFKTSRSSGPGGQNVNKVNTKVELRFDITNSLVFNDYEKDILSKRLKSRITSENILVIISQASRSQLKNKNEALQNLFKLIEQALTPIKKRKPTKPTTASKLKRSNDKKHQAEKKSLRKNIKY